MQGHVQGRIRMFYRSFDSSQMDALGLLTYLALGSIEHYRLDTRAHVGFSRLCAIEYSVTPGT